MKTFLVIISAFLLFHDACGIPPLVRPKERSKASNSLMDYLGSIQTVLDPSLMAWQTILAMNNYDSLTDVNLKTATYSLTTLCSNAWDFGTNVTVALTNADQHQGMGDFVNAFNTLIAAMAQTIQDVQPVSDSIANDLQGSLSDLQASQQDPVFKKNSEGKPLINAFNKATIRSVEEAIKLCMDAVNQAATAFVSVYQSLSQ